MAAIDIFSSSAPADAAVAAQAHALAAEFEGQPASVILEAAINTLFRGQIALVSSFGADSAVLLQLVADIDRDLPVLFMDTEKLFPETLAYRDTLVAQLGLTGIRNIVPRPELVSGQDPDGQLWYFDPDTCCGIRKVEPLARSMTGFGAWITGRKRHQAATRASLPVFEAEESRIKVNPLVNWGRKELNAFMAERNLPPHPLVAEGYKSIGCAPCTSKVAEGEDERAGRWRGTGKTECGIHIALPGQKAPSAQA